MYPPTEPNLFDIRLMFQTFHEPIRCLNRLSMGWNGKDLASKMKAQLHTFAAFGGEEYFRTDRRRPEHPLPDQHVIVEMFSDQLY